MFIEDKVAKAIMNNKTLAPKIIFLILMTP